MTASSARQALAIVFPGQGSQRPGMARDFHDRFAVSRDAFAEASEALDLDVAALCFADDPRLDQTAFTQPAILTAEIAMLRALCAERGLAPTHFGGHSLGEYTALCAAGVMSLPTAVRLVRRRGALMQAAVPAGAGAMLAVVSPGIAARDLGGELADLEVDVANENSPDQVVLSGSTAAIERAAARLAERLAGAPNDLRPLNVSGPFHSRMMQGAEAAFRAELEALGPALAAERAGCVTSNLTGGFHRPERPAVVDALTRQISGTVRWTANMQALSAAAGRIVEVGPARPLRSFFKHVGHDVTSVVTVAHVIRTPAPAGAIPCTSPSRRETCRRV